jgi:signal transduction histidine kinase
VQIGRAARQTWLSLVFICLDLWVLIPASIVLTIGISLVSGLAITVIGGAVALAGTMLTLAFLDRFERARTAALLDVHVVPPRRKSGPHRFGPIGRVCSDRSYWKSIAYWLLKMVQAPLGFALAVGAWCAGVVLATLPLHLPLMPDGVAHLWVADVSTPAQQAVSVSAGLAVLVLAPLVTRLVARVDTGLVRNLLGDTRIAELEERLGVVDAKRAAAVDAAEAERRRIERDLHDGAQQRLVALAMSIGMAKEKLDSDPAVAKALIDEAHIEAKAAMTELRNIARGIHPAVLTDRGLDAALSGLVARTPVPIALTVSLGEERLPDAIEGGVYYVVAEALTNITKHAEASSASVTLVRRGDRVVIEVNDNGRGGASIRPGGGLAGLLDRVTSLGGFLHVSSPSGGPTSLLVELSCAS